MNCRTFCESIEAFLDGEADLVVRETMEPHAASCASCRKQLAAARKTRGLMEVYAAPQAPAGFAARAAQAAQGAEPISIGSAFRWRAAAAAVFLAVGGGLGIYFLMSAEGTKDPGGQAPVAQEPAIKQPPVSKEEVPVQRESLPVAESNSNSIEEQEIAENLEILENWELLNDPDVAIALALPDEDFEVLMSALEEGI